MGERYNQKAREYESKVLAVSHLVMEVIIWISMESVYRLLGIPKEKRTLRHAEIFLVTTTVLFIGLVSLAQFWQGLGWCVVVLGNLRILQIICLNLNTLLFDFSTVGDGIMQVKKARWHFVAIGFSFLDTVLIFGFLFQFLDRRYEILNQHGTNFLHYLYYTVITITTLGYGDIHPVTALGMILAMYEAMIALMFLVFFVSGAVGRLQRHV